jgi:uncharacterized protein (TIGR00661 family)
LQIARHLAASGHQVEILTFGQGFDYFRRTEFRDRCHKVFAPWIECDNQGVRWLDTIRMNWSDGPAGFALNRRTIAALSRSGMRPNVCVADYEPVSGWLARQVGAPLVTVDQQSKYLGYEIAPVRHMTRIEERSRLAVFFPKAAKRIATSFYRIDAPPDKKFRVDLVPPIIREDVAVLAERDRKIDDQFVLVYLSGYAKKNSFVDATRLVGVLGRLTSWRFKMYSHNPPTIELPSNVRVQTTLSGEFVDDLSRASALICTAGFTLLSEAMSLGIPVLTAPLFSYDQHLCARVIAEAGAGMAVDSENGISEEVLTKFLSRLEEFRLGIVQSDKLLRTPSREVIREVCDEIVAAA